jgi:hypothetical protein
MANKVKASNLEYNNKTSIINYINWLEYIVSTYRDNTILLLLLFIIKGTV